MEASLDLDGDVREPLHDPGATRRSLPVDDRQVLGPTEVAAEYLGKGSPVLIEGRLRVETWETDGQKRSKLKVVGERMQMLGKAKGASNANEADAVPAGAPEDDIPF